MQYTKISILIKTDARVPYFIGSQLRGALGYALKKVTCINPSYKCDGCFVAENCLYYKFYEMRNMPHHYRFDFDLGKDFYAFDFYLFESACEKLPYVVSAFHMMLTQNGLGKERKIYKNFDMYINDTSCFTDGQFKLPKDFIKTFQIDKIYQDIQLEFKTPLRMKKNNRFVKKEELTLKDLVNSVYQRQMKLLGKKPRRFPYEIEGEIVKNELYFKELRRMSNRQKTTMNMGGLMGVLKIKGLNDKAFHVLKLAELIGAGKQTVFGLGKLQIKEY